MRNKQNQFKKFFGICVLAALSTFAPRAAAQSGPIVWTAPSMQRVGQNETPGTNTQAQLRAARGEYESFQIAVRAPTGGLTNVSVAVSDLTGPAGQIIPKSNLALFREQYVYVSQGSPNYGGSNQPLGPGYYADGLIPAIDPATGNPPSGGTLRAFPFNLAAGTNQPVWVDVLVPRTAAAGLYTGTYTVTSGQGSVSGQIALTVWNFTLPVKPALRSSFLYWTAGTVPAQQELLRNRVEAHLSTASAERSLIDSYGLNATGIGLYSGANIGNCTMSSAPSISQFQSAAASHQPDLFLYDYSADEIDTCPNLFPTLKQWGYNMHQAGIKNLVTMTPNPNLFDDGSGTGRSAVDVWVMLPVMYDGAPTYIGQALAKGDELWSYNTLVQDSYSPKWEIDFAPINFRIEMGFIHQSLQMKGNLYWQIDRWTADPWNDINGFPGYPGDGMLVYPGTQIGIQGVAPSLRLKWIRDGVDDFDYVELLKQQGEGAWALQVARTVGPDWTNWTRDINALEAARTQLGQELDRLGGGSTPSVPAPGTPGSPSPASGATGVAQTTTLAWSAASNATSYDVYFGTTASPALAASVTATSFNPGALAAGVTYYWQVVAKNATGSTASPVWSFATQAIPAPSVPANPSPASGATGVPQATTLAWSAASNATSYDVYFGTTSSPALAASVTATSFNPGALAAGVTYYWKVAAKNASGATPSALWSFTTQAAPAPGAPANPSPASGATGVPQTTTLAWSAASNASSYDVYFGTTASPALAASVTATSFNPGALAAGVTYYWKVAAKNASGTTPSALWSFTTQAAPAPGVPANPSPASGATGVAQTTTLAWSAASNASSYDVYFGTTATPALATTVTSTSYNPGALAAGTTYYWKVVAKNSVGSTASPLWSFSAAAAVSAPALTVSPSSGSGFSQVFQFTYSNPNGYSGLQGINALFSPVVDGRYSCWVYYDRPSNRLWLSRDDMSDWDSMVLGTAGSLQNSQCVVNVGASSTSRSSSAFTVNLAVTFKASFAGTKKIYMRASDSTGLFNNYAAKGVWTIPLVK